MPALITFTSLADALLAGYQVVSRNAEGYTVRTRTRSGWGLALVRLTVPPVGMHTAGGER